MEERQDLISRQEAIDAMCMACGHDCDKSKFVYNAPQDEQVIMCPEHYALSTLLSAQPTEESCWGCNCPKMEKLNEQKTFSEMVHLHDAKRRVERTKSNS